MNTTTQPRASGDESQPSPASAVPSRDIPEEQAVDRVMRVTGCDYIAIYRDRHFKFGSAYHVNYQVVAHPEGRVPVSEVGPTLREAVERIEGRYAQ